MRCVVRVIAWVVLVISAAACTPLETQYVREGIGTDLYRSDMPVSTSLQNVYLEMLCRQASPTIGMGQDPNCDGTRLVPPAAWPLIVLAGMNDIDQRCDAYLAWLDQKKRENSAILAEIAAIRIATDAILNPTITHGVGPRTLAAVAAAFGLATNTLSNVNSLLLQVDHTTVQFVVFGRRKDFRRDLSGVAINSKPMAVHALRSYLTICMPMTIAADINSTVTVFQQGGSGALDNRSLVDSGTVAAPLTATQKIEKQERRFVPAPAEFAEIFENVANLSKTDVERVQRALCLPENNRNEIGRVGEVTKVLIDLYENTSRERGTKIDGKISTSERQEILRQPSCATAKNFFEKVTYASTSVTAKQNKDNIKELFDQLNLSPVGGKLDFDPETSTLSQARQKISAVRGDPLVTRHLTLRLPASFSDHVTRDLIIALRRPRN